MAAYSRQNDDFFISGLRRSDVQGPQDGPVCLLTVLQGPPRGEPREAPHYHP